MEEIKDKPNWVGVPQLENGNIIHGGEDGLANIQAKVLADRTAHLKEEIKKAESLGQELPESEESNLPEITDITKGWGLTNNGETILWKEVPSTGVWISSEGYLPTRNAATIVAHGLNLSTEKAYADILLKCVAPDIGYEQGEYCFTWGSESINTRAGMVFISNSTLEFYTGQSLWGIHKKMQYQQL